jgi:multiple sugar transport system ATP-binding protein
MVLVGPSGSGKSTLMRIVAGLETATSGAITIGGRDVTNLQPGERDVAMVFQNYALYPHMEVRKNLAYSLKVRRMPKKEINRRVAEVAELLGLDDLLDRKPGQLSGGQRQRVAMGRAIIREPQAFLMDEPLSNLDAKLRVAVRASLIQLHERLGVTTLYVTHDQVEAMTLGHRVAVLSDGQLLQVDTPQELYRNPKNLFVATFMGSPAMNVAEATIKDGEVFLGSFRIPLSPERRPPSSASGKIVLGIRPEDFEDAYQADRGFPSFDVDVTVREDLGSGAHIVFPVDAPRVDLVAVDDADDRLIAQQTNFFVASIGARTKARAGSRLRLAVDPSRFYFFDPATGENLLAK